ncbi:MAG TPA: hypothetical protein QF695_09375 [Arenicellales bacterium]|nr:hypothetical protein [Arenicellales bacterium]
MTDNMSGYAINTYSYTLSHTVTRFTVSPFVTSTPFKKAHQRVWSG